MRTYTIRVLRRTGGASVETVSLVGLAGMISRVWADRSVVSVTVWDCGGVRVGHWERASAIERRSVAA